MTLFDADRRKSWQRLSLSIFVILLSTGLLLWYFIGEATWGQVVIAALGLFVGSETVRHYKRLEQKPSEPRRERPADEPSAEPYGEEPV